MLPACKGRWILMIDSILFADVGVFIYHIQHFIREIFRMRGSEPYPHILSLNCHHFQELSKPIPLALSEFIQFLEPLGIPVFKLNLLGFIVIGIDVLSQQQDFLVTFLLQLLNFVEN